MIRVGVLRGGTSDEFDISIKSGATVLASLPRDKYRGVDILITKDGTWHMGGTPKTLGEISLQVDVVFNALHGEYGEDGRVSRMLEQHGIPYTGSEAIPSSLAVSKSIAKDIFKRAGIKTPNGITIEDYREQILGKEKNKKIEELAYKIFNTISPPWVLKPARGGSSINTLVAKNFSELYDALTQLFDYGGDLVVEQYLYGKEVSAGVIENFRQEKRYPILPVEVMKDGGIFDFHSKQKGVNLICPSTLSQEQKEEVMYIAERAHEILGLRDYSVSDFIVTPKGVYITEINNNPKCMACSILAKSLEAVGSNMGELIDHLVSQAVLRKVKN